MNKGTKISICIIVKNGEKYLKRCLTSIKNYAYEIIIVDTGSEDKSIFIAKSFTKKFYTFNWNGNFSEARNFCMSKANGDYILWLDYDEFFFEKDIKNLLKIIKTTNYNYYRIKRCNYINEKLEFTDFITKVYKNTEGLKFEGIIHESIIDIKKGVELHNIELQHNFILGNKIWYNMDKIIEIFDNDTNNSAIAFKIIEYFLFTKNDLEEFQNYLTKIEYIDYRFIDLFKERILDYLFINKENDYFKSAKKLFDRSLEINYKKYGFKLGDKLEIIK